MAAEIYIEGEINDESPARLKAQIDVVVTDPRALTALRVTV